MGSKALDETFSDISIPQKTKIDNTFDEKSLENSSDKQYALPMDDDAPITGAEVMSWLKRRQEEESKIDLDRTSKN